ncbi:unnamed protein product [Schistosoma margrebowiei]|uniref:ERAP1-like C-terminal domain-containing protein n=1 Tax=Schistosoma margrebowiei TaxID=48269 RepID=A0A183M1K0_9TREM|nr:unnamed protein product [Schistosoma margrebowiei]
MNSAFTMKRHTSSNILPDLRFITYCTVIRHGGQEEWEFLENQLILNDTVNENENENKMLALTCSRDKEIMKRYFERIRENENLWFTLDYFAKSPVGNQLLWDHLIDVNNFIKHKDFTESMLNALTKYPYSLFSGRNYEKVSEEPVYFPSLYKCYFVSSHILRFNFPNVII